MTDCDENRVDPVTSRRTVLLGAGALGAVGLLAACGTGAGSKAGNGRGSSQVIKAADIPVGGGKIFPDAQIVVTQPTTGTFKAFTAVCTHQGCVVGKVE